MNVLIVEDEIKIRQLLTYRFIFWDFEVESVSTKKEALGLIIKKEFDLVLLDIFLPDGLGYQIIPKIREIHPETKIITMTGSNTKELEAKTREYGVEYYLIKPFEIENLERIVKYIRSNAHGTPV